MALRSTGIIPSVRMELRESLSSHLELKSHPLSAPAARSEYSKSVSSTRWIAIRLQKISSIMYANFETRLNSGCVILCPFDLRIVARNKTKEWWRRIMRLSNLHTCRTVTSMCSFGTRYNWLTWVVGSVEVLSVWLWSGDIQLRPIPNIVIHNISHGPILNPEFIFREQHWEDGPEEIHISGAGHVDVYHLSQQRRLGATGVVDTPTIRYKPIPTYIQKWDLPWKLLHSRLR